MVRIKNTNSILFKNMMDTCVGAIGFYFMGYAIAFGNGEWALVGFNKDNFHLWFFQWAFSSTAATIVSGPIAERCTLEAHLVYSLFSSTLIYPPIVWIFWSEHGFLSPYRVNGNGELSPHLTTGVIDFAGSGVVHLLGGIGGLVGSIIIGPRFGWLANGKKFTTSSNNDLLSSLGTLILWMGWYGFNCGSTLSASGSMGDSMDIASKVAVTSTLSAAMAGIVVAVYCRIFRRSYILSELLNGVLSGLVAITSGCAVVRVWSSLLIGGLSGMIFIGTSILLKKQSIDDPLDAFAVHGACGMWGLLSVGIFATRENIKRVYGIDSDSMETGAQFANQLVGAVFITVWTTICSVVVFSSLSLCNCLRVSFNQEIVGLDITKHGKMHQRSVAKVGSNKPSFDSGNLSDAKVQRPQAKSLSPKKRIGSAIRLTKTRMLGTYSNKTSKDLLKAPGVLRTSASPTRLLRAKSMPSADGQNTSTRVKDCPMSSEESIRKNCQDYDNMLANASAAQLGTTATGTTIATRTSARMMTPFHLYKFPLDLPSGKTRLTMSGLSLRDHNLSTHEMIQPLEGKKEGEGKSHGSKVK